MKLEIFVIYDSKAKVYNRPFYVINQDIAIRTVRDAMADPNTDLNKHPEDFSLFALGDYDDENGKIDPHPPLHVISLHELKFPDLNPPVYDPNDFPTEEH